MPIPPAMARLAFLLVALLPATRVAAQDSDSTRVLDAARAVVREVDWCTLVTTGLDGHPRARVMDPFAPEEDWVVWLATKARSRKVEEIRNDPRVTVHWADPAGSGYVSLLGRATLVTDRAERAARWKEDWATFYSDRNQGDDYLLIRVDPIRLEVVSIGDGILGDPETWQPAGVDL